MKLILTLYTVSAVSCVGFATWACLELRHMDKTMTTVSHQFEPIALRLAASASAAQDSAEPPKRDPVVDARAIHVMPPRP